VTIYLITTLKEERKVQMAKVIHYKLTCAREIILSTSRVVTFCSSLPTKIAFVGGAHEAFRAGEREMAKRGKTAIICI
jgi:hypothetical protein